MSITDLVRCQERPGGVEEYIANRAIQLFGGSKKEWWGTSQANRRGCYDEAVAEATEAKKRQDLGEPRYEG